MAATHVTERPFRLTSAAIGRPQPATRAICCLVSRRLLFTRLLRVRTCVQPDRERRLLRTPVPATLASPSMASGAVERSPSSRATSAVSTSAPARKRSGKKLVKGPRQPRLTHSPNKDGSVRPLSSLVEEQASERSTESQVGHLMLATPLMISRTALDPLPCRSIWR